MLKDNKAIEYTCYSIGAGAFGIFVRWMQIMLARNEEGLFDNSFWNFAVPGLIVLASIFYVKFIKQYKKNRMYVPDSFYKAFANNSKFFNPISWAICIIMIAGGGLLFWKSDADLNVKFFRILAILGMLSGLTFPFIINAANRPHTNNITLVTIASFIPILFFAFWLVTAYKQYAISSIGWQYVVELFTVSVSMLAFFRVAGFAYCSPNWPKAMFTSMLAASCCIMSLSDSRYMGQQIMLVGSAMTLLVFNWLMITNMQQHKKSKYENVNELDLTNKQR